MPKIIPPLTTNSSGKKKDSIQMVGISQASIFLNGKVSPFFFNRQSISYITFLELSHAIISLYVGIRHSGNKSFPDLSNYISKNVGC